MSNLPDFYEKSNITFICKTTFFEDKHKCFEQIANFLTSNNVKQIENIKGPFIDEHNKEMYYSLTVTRKIEA